MAAVELYQPVVTGWSPLNSEFLEAVQTAWEQ
jgi:hypothetical protein